MKPFLMKFARPEDEPSDPVIRVTAYAIQQEILIYKNTSNIQPVMDDISSFRGTGTTVTFAHQDPSRDEDCDR